MGKTHALSGVLAGVCTLDVVGALPADQVKWVAMLGGIALLPDLDMPRSSIGRMWGPLTGGVKLGRWTVVPGMATIVSKVAGGHREGTHSFVAMIVTLVAVYVAQFHPIPTAFVIALATGLTILAADFVIPGKIGWPINLAVCAGVAVASYTQGWELPGWACWAYAAGMLVHCLGDEMTKERVKWDWPFHTATRDRRRNAKRERSRWRFRTGGGVEQCVLVAIVSLTLVVIAYQSGYDPLGTIYTALKEVEL